MIVEMFCPKDMKVLMMMMVMVVIFFLFALKNSCLDMPWMFFLPEAIIRMHMSNFNVDYDKVKVMAIF